MNLEYTIKRGMPFPMGVSHADEAVNIVAEFPHSHGKVCGIVIVTADHETLRIPFSEKFRIGNLYCVRVEQWKRGMFQYEFFIGEETFVDPYARLITGREKWGSTAERKLCAVFEEEENPQGWENDAGPMIPYENSILYSLHVRGFTRHASSRVADRGTFEGVVEKIPYLKELGITAIECMPIYEFDEIIRNTAYQSTPKQLAPSQTMPVWEQRMNYWGFSDHGNYYFAPKSAYAAGSHASFSVKSMVQALHQNGLECIMQIYFPVSCKPAFILDVLRFWVLTYHMDGFHLMGVNLPMELLGSDPLLARVKLITEKPMADQIYAGCKQPPEFKNLASYQDDFRADSRRYLKGDEDMLYKMSRYMTRNSEWEASVSHITDYRGFTLMDLVSYDRKHNEANGEENRDGSNYNYSWNCGAEGPSRKKSVQTLRLSQRKNALSFLMLSQATPLLLAGDEFGHSAGGNNNAYCQDNKVNWLNWKFDKNGEEMFAFTKQLIAFRKAHPILHSQKMMRMMDYESCGYPDVSYHGEQAWYARFENYNRHLGILFCGMYEKKPDGSSDDFIYVAMNMHWVTHEFALPLLPQGFAWQPVYATRSENVPRMTELYAGRQEGNEKMIVVPPRSVVVLIGEKDTRGMLQAVTAEHAHEVPQKKTAADGRELPKGKTVADGCEFPKGKTAADIREIPKGKRNKEGVRNPESRKQ